MSCRLELPQLGYEFNALEPHIDATTMEIHYLKHHNAYVNNLKKALENAGEWKESCPCKLIRNLKKLPKEIQTAVRNNAGGHVNHSLFWKILQPGGDGMPSGELDGAINRDFGSFEAFKKTFSQAATTRFGSGWAWLCKDSKGKLSVCSTANQDNPIMGSFVEACGNKPILGLDIWEHAYYLRYQNRRPEYIEAFFNAINWTVVSESYNKSCC